MEVKNVLLYLVQPSKISLLADQGNTEWYQVIYLSDISYLS